jgi:hypothetical protein
MTQILINLEVGPDHQPAGELTAGTGRPTAFTGWLHLIRLLEEQLDKEAGGPENPARRPGQV